MGAVIALSVAEIRRLLATLEEDEERFDRRLRWSHFRRRHQAQAHRCHRARQARTAPACQEPAPPWLLATGVGELTEARWSRILALLAGQSPRLRVTEETLRAQVEGMLWVIATGATWEELPVRSGRLPAVYARYDRWRTSGLWQRIVAILAPSTTSPTNVPL
jgi:hypothetical protein